AHGRGGGGEGSHARADRRPDGPSEAVRGSESDSGHQPSGGRDGGRRAMKLSEMSIQRPVFATVMSLAIILFGVIAFSRLPVREYPDIDPPVVSITTFYRGASPSVVETE